jgi:hypothetical protein
MILIADSGSTKTHWCLVQSGVVVSEIFTEIKKIFFYGAGCSFPEKKMMVSLALINFFNDAIIEVQSDLLAAARSLFQHEKGIACILGTGSNSCFYDGYEIAQNVSPLGFILGDEGSGAVLGKLLVADCLKNQVPEWLSEKLLDEYELTPAIILENVYKKPFPNRFLAKFTPFLLEHIEEPAIFNLVYDSFDAFFLRNVMQYPLEDVEVGFVGSIAYYFKDTLEIVASERGIVVSQITQSPMEGLVRFHTN